MKVNIMKISFIYTALAVCLSISAVQATEQRDCPGDFRLSNQKAQGQAHKDVGRAGVILCKDYGQDSLYGNDRYAIILGHDHRQKLWNFQAGKIEKGHKYTTDTAAAELEEETGGLVKYNAGALRKLPFVCSGKKQLFFLSNPNDQNIGVHAIRDACRAAVKNHKLDRSYREVDNAVDVSVLELLSVAKMIKDKRLGKQKTYTLQTRHGQPIEISGTYMRVLAYRYDHVRAIFNQIFNVNIF